MNCVAKYPENFLEFRTILSDGRNNSANCNYLPNCVHSNVHVTRIINMYFNDKVQAVKLFGVILMYKEYPLIRYKRKIIFTLMDLFGEVQLSIFIGKFIKTNNNEFDPSISKSVDWWNSLIVHWIHWNHLLSSRTFILAHYGQKIQHFLENLR